MSAREPLEEGQLWSIRGMANAVALIGRIDDEDEASIVHLFVTIDTPPHLVARFGPRLELGHMPLYRDTVTEALDTRLKTQQMPPSVFAEGYAAWRADEEAGVFDMPLQDAIESVVAIALGGTN
jgi:hypothetical protein